MVIEPYWGVGVFDKAVLNCEVHRFRELVALGLDDVAVQDVNAIGVVRKSQFDRFVNLVKRIIRHLCELQYYLHCFEQLLLSDVSLVILVQIIRKKLRVRVVWNVLEI